MFSTLTIYLCQAGGRTDSAVIAWLEALFEENIHTVADEKLQKVVDKKGVGFTYASTVLFPETFIHQQETMGNSREEAEVIFLKVGEVEEEERLALRREIKEAAKRQEVEAREAKRQEEVDKDYEEEWVDHSDLDE